LADWIKLMTAAARCPAISVPANSQFLRPVAQGPDLLLIEVVVDQQCRIVQVARERNPALQAVVDCPGRGSAVRYQSALRNQPIVHRLGNR